MCLFAKLILSLHPVTAHYPPLLISHARSHAKFQTPFRVLYRPEMSATTVLDHSIVTFFYLNVPRHMLIASHVAPELQAPPEMVCLLSLHFFSSENK
jgi:hypothetical protein